MKSRGFLTLCLMLTFFLGNVTGQIQESYKQFPTLPDRPFVPPAAGQLQAWQEFQNSHPDWQVRWDKETGAPASLLGKPMDVARGTPEAIARQFLLMNRDIFRMKTELADLTVSKISPMLRATHVVFTQSYAGIPVEGGVYAVHITKENKVYLANGDYFDNVQVATTEPAIALENAINTAKEDLGAGLKLRDTPSGELVILPYGADFLLSWKVAVPSDEPFGEWIYFISASDGSILTGYNSADFADASGSVYDHHPEAGSVVYRTLTNLVSPGYYLNGNYVRAYNDDTSEAYETDLTYYYSPSNTHFDEVMVYYHANRFQDIYLDDLNYPYLNYPNSLVKVEATVHYGTNWNNASASYPKTLRFGDGDGIIYNDFAKEDVVIFHEYQHLVTEYTTYDGLDGGHEEDAMDEAFSDYFGCSFAGTSKMGEYVKVGSGSIRNLDNSYTVSDWVAAGYPHYYSYHDGSIVFSGAQWDMRQEFGQGISDILSFEGLNNLTQASPDFSDGRWAIIAADYANYGGSHVCTIKSIFGNRGIGSTPSIPPAPTGLYIVNEGEYDEEVQLDWNNSTGATSYKVYRRFDGGSWSCIVTTTHSHYDDYGATVNYYSDYLLEYYVKALNCIGVSGQSNIASDWGYLEKRVIPNEGSNIPVAYSLKPNHPNPFNPATAIRYDLPEASRITLTIYDMMGREVRSWVLHESAGYRQVVWDGKDQNGRSVPTGVYIYRLVAISSESDKRFTAVRKMLLMK